MQTLNRLLLALGPGDIGINVLNSTPSSVGSIINSITNILFWIVGVASVGALIVGGLMYITSAGDPGRTKSAKDTIMYAVIGLIVAILAFAIVNFVLTRIK